MRKIILLSFLQFILLFGATSQESRDYFSPLEKYNHASDLYANQLYPAAYDLFTQIIEDDKDELNLFSSQQIINAQLYQALSATLSGQQIGIPLVQQFMEEYPESPNRSLAHLELGKYYAANRLFGEAFNEFEQVNTSALTDEQLLDFNMNAGYTYFIRKKFKTAETYLQSAASYPSANQQDAIYYLALSQYFLDKHDAALENFKRVENHPRYGSEISFYFARILFERGEYEQVLTYKGQSDNPELQQIIGQSYFNLERYQEALPYLESYSQNASSQSPEALYQLAYTQYQLGENMEAIANFEKLNIVDDEIGQYALYALAESYLKVRDKEKALQAFSRAAQLDFNKEIKENASFSEAKLSYELGRNNDAIELMQSFIQDYPRSSYRAEADEYLVDLFLNSTNYQDAIAILEKMDPRSSRMNEAYQKVTYLRAVELYHAEDYTESKTLFDIVIDNNHDKRYTALANYWLGEMAYEFGRYAMALDYMQLFLNSSVDKPASYISQANYTSGYAQYRLNQYQKAANLFSKVSASSSFRNDANLREGDSYFLTKNYASALRSYQMVNNGTPQENDYAKFQAAILLGLQGNRSQKSSQLQQLYVNSPNSAYADEALFEHGRMALTQENYSVAESRFQKLLNDYPKSDKVKDAYNQLGLLHFNQANYNRALENYDQVVRKFPNTEDAATALQAIEAIYIQQGNPDGYFAYLKTVKGVSVDSNEQERIVYTAAETQFQNGNCSKATEGFSNYINKYPNGFYSANAHFYRGECFNQTGNQKQAVDDFRVIANMNQNKFTERALIRVARYDYRTGDYRSAIRFYENLNELSAQSENIYADEVNIGLMQAYNRVGERASAYGFARKVKMQTQLDFNITNEAEFLLAMQKFDAGDTSNAYLDLDRVAAKTRDQWGAEARYIMALILHNQKQYTNSTNAAYRVADETPNEDDWVAKAFIIVARNYKGQNELFQAKATVESVIENYKGQDASIRNEANQLLAEIKRLELNNSNLLNKNSNDNQLQLKEE